MSDQAPADIRELAAARAAARSAGDWPEADRLRARIEDAGWKVVDAGTTFRLAPTVAADRVEDGRVRYGASASVPSRLGEPAVDGATVVVRATDRPDEVQRLLEGLRRHAPAGTQVVIVADAPSRGQAAALDGPADPVLAPLEGTEPEGRPEVVWTATRLGVAGGLNAGIRRASRAVVIVLDSSVEPTGDFITPLMGALAEPTIAIVGAWGSTTTDLRRFDPSPPGDVAVVDGGLLAFRRDEVVTRGPLDETFRTGRHLEAWWSLVLRDAGEGIAPRRAVRLADLPVVRHDEPGDEAVARAAEADSAFPTRERGRLDKRAFYRIVDRFGRRTDLIVGP